LLFTLPNSIVGAEIEPDEQQVDARWVMAYNAALGERSSEPHPLFPVCYEWPATRRLRERAGLGGKAARLGQGRGRDPAPARRARGFPLHHPG
jgi:hypothetical protein